MCHGWKKRGELTWCLIQTDHKLHWLHNNWTGLYKRFKLNNAYVQKHVECGADYIMMWGCTRPCRLMQVNPKNPVGMTAVTLEIYSFSGATTPNIKTKATQEWFQNNDVRVQNSIQLRIYGRTWNLSSWNLTKLKQLCKEHVYVSVSQQHSAYPPHTHTHHPLPLSKLQYVRQRRDSNSSNQTLNTHVI